MSSPIDRSDTEAVTRVLQHWLHQRMPERPGLTITSVQRPTGAGFSNETLIVHTRWPGQRPEEESRLVVQIGPAGDALFPHYDLAHMFELQSRLAQHSDVPVATMLWLEPDTQLLGAEFYAMAYTPGDVPADEPPYHADGFMTELAQEQHATLWWSGVEAMARLHRLDPVQLQLTLPTDDPIDRRLEYWEEFEHWATHGECADLTRRAVAWLREHRPRHRLPLSVTWGDAKLGNMIFDDLRCRAILDWELSGIGYAEEDLAHWLFMDRQAAFRGDCARLPGLPEAAQTIDRYQQRLGRDVHDLGWWEVYSCYRLAVIVQRIFFFLRRDGVFPTDTPLEQANIIMPLLEQTLAQA